MSLESEFFLIVTKKKALRVVHHKGDHGFSPSGGQIYISLMIETDWPVYDEIGREIGRT